MRHALRFPLVLAFSTLALTACGQQAGADDEASSAPETVPGVQPAAVPPPPGSPQAPMSPDSLNAASAQAGTQDRVPAGGTSSTGQQGQTQGSAGGAETEGTSTSSGQ